MGGENRREIVPRALSSPPQYASARRGTSSNATPLVLNNSDNNNNNNNTYIALISLLLSVHQRLKKIKKQTGVFHCFYLVLVTMQFSTADEASVSAAIHSSKFMSVNP